MCVGVWSPVHSVRCALAVWFIDTGPKPTITSVRASSSDLSIALAWQMPWQLKYQTFIIGYRVQFGTSTSTSALQSIFVSTTAANSSTTISSLAPYTTYYFRVALRVSASHFGPYSDFVSARTIPGGMLSVHAWDAHPIPSCACSFVHNNLYHLFDLHNVDKTHV